MGRLSRRLLPGPRQSSCPDTHLTDWTERCPSIVTAIEALPAETAIIDVEAIVNDERGLSNFSRMQQALGGDASAIRIVVFDLLYLDGEDFRERSLEERRGAVAGLLSHTPPAEITFSEEIEGEPDHIFRHACRVGLEGVVSKQRDSPYCSGRRKVWLKTKCIQSDEFVVIGYELGKGFGGLGRLHLGRYENGELIEIGGVGTGFTDRTAREVI